MTDITMIPGEPESVHVNNEGAGLSSAPSPKEEEEKTMLIDIVPSTSPKIETMPMPPAIVSDPDAAAGPPLPPPPPMALPLPSQQEQQESSTSPNNSTTAKAVVSSSKKSRPPYKYDPEKVTLRFLFANKDGLTVTVECNPGDTVGEVKGALLSVWPEGLPDCSGGDRLRLICMGKGILMPDTRTLEDLQVPVFKTHPTPVNVSVKPNSQSPTSPSHKSSDHHARGNHGRHSHNTHNNAANNNSQPNSTLTTQQADQGCGCIIL